MFLTPEDLAAFATIDSAKAEQMIEDAEAMALLAAPCLSGALTSAQAAGVKAVLRQALMRWQDAGSGAVTQQQAGPWMQSVDTRQERKGMFWPSEIAQLRDICAGFSGADSTGAYTIDTAPSWGGRHSPFCSLMFGALYCSCGSDINNYEGPLYEGGSLS